MNQLSVNLQHSIPALAAKGWSARKIARELAINRETAGRYLRLRASRASKPAILPAGSSEPAEPKPAILPTGSVAGRSSQCRPWTESQPDYTTGCTSPRMVRIRSLCHRKQFTMGCRRRWRD